MSSVSVRHVGGSLLKDPWYGRRVWIYGKVLEEIFKKTPSEAVRIMLAVHNNGSGVAGIYARQIAEAKIALVHQKARGEGFPLMCDLEEIPNV